MISLEANLRQSSLDDDESVEDRDSSTLSTQRVISSPTVFSPGSAVRALAQVPPWEQTYFVSASKKPQDSVALYQHRLRVDHSSVRKLHEVIATVEALKQQRATTTSDDD